MDDDPYFRDHGRRRAAREQRRRDAREQDMPQSEAAPAVTAVSVAGSFVVGQGSQRVCTGERVRVSFVLQVKTAETACNKTWSSVCPCDAAAQWGRPRSCSSAPAPQCASWQSTQHRIF